MRMKPALLAVSFVLLIAIPLSSGVSQTPEDLQKGVYAKLKGDTLSLRLSRESRSVSSNMGGLRTISISTSSPFLGERISHPLSEFTGKITVTFRTESDENSKETMLTGRDFTISPRTPVDASVEIDFDENRQLPFGATCSASARRCEASVFSAGDSSLYLAFGKHYPLEIDYVDDNRHKQSVTLMDIVYIEGTITSGPKVGPFLQGPGPIYSFVADAFIPKGENEILVTLADLIGRSTSVGSQEVVVKGKRLELKNTKIEQFRVVAQKQQVIRAFLGFRSAGTDVVFEAASSGPSLVAINGEQVIEGEIGNSLVNPVRVALQDVTKSHPEIEFSIYEKSRSVDLMNVVVSSGGKLGGVVKFHEPSLYPAVSDFFIEHGELFAQLEKKYAAAEAAQSKKERRAFERNVVEERADAILAAYILDYLKKRKTIEDDTFDRLSKVRNKSLFFSPDAIAATKDHKAFIELAREARGRDFLDYLMHVNPNDIPRPPASASLDKAWDETLQELKNWFPARLDRGASEQRISSLKYDEEKDITLGLHFPRDLEAKEYDAEIVVTGTKVPETHIPLVIQVYDRTDWIKSALIWFAGAVGAALIGYIVWRIQESQTRKLASAEMLVVEFRGGKYVAVSYKDIIPFLALQAELRVHNRRDTPTSIYCDNAKVQTDEASEDFPAPEFQPAGGDPIDMRLQIQVEANSTSQINLYSKKLYPEGITRYTFFTQAPTYRLRDLPGTECPSL